MTPTEQRDRATRLARDDFRAASRAAQHVSAAWFRAQALAAVARWAPDDEVGRLASLAELAADACDDDYGRAAVRAWPVRALIERGHHDEAAAMLERALQCSGSATPPASHSAALELLLHAAWPLGASFRRRILLSLASLARSDLHWRIARALRDGIAMVRPRDEAFARELTAAIADDKLRGKVLRAMASAPSPSPREFFW